MRFRNVVFEDVTLVIDCAPQLVGLAVDFHENLVKVPAPLSKPQRGADKALPYLACIHRPLPVPPEPDGLVAQIDAALEQQVLDVSQA